MTERWRMAVIAMALAGLADSAYLVLDVLSPSVVLYCPTAGFVNCAKLTQSPHSEFLGVSVAYMGVAWFAAVLVLAVLRTRATFQYLLLPLWGIGALFVFYLIFIEVFVLNAICTYCTLAHALALAIGIPIVRAALESD